MKSGVFIGCPSYDGRMDQGCAANLFSNASADRQNCVMIARFLSVAPASNTLLASALNARESVLGMEDCTEIGWFAMLHSDINPGPFWVDRLIEEAEEYGADLMSAVVPIKSEKGMTSTGMSDPDDPMLNWCRLAVRQVKHESFPKTFDSEMAREALASLPYDMSVECPEESILLVNTGCMVYRLDRPWSGNAWFEQVDRIDRVDGRWKAIIRPEDWNFSRMVTERGGKVMATTVVETSHTGPSEFGITAGGGWARDHENLLLKIDGYESPFEKTCRA